MRVIVIILILVLNSCSAQVQNTTSKKSVFCCYQQAAKITGNMPAGTMRQVKKGKSFGTGYKIDDGQALIIRSSITGNPIELHSKESEIDDWNDAVITDSVISYISKDNRYLVCYAPIKDATGLAVNFSKWIFIDLVSGNFYIDQNFRSSPFMVYSSSKGLVFYLFDYSENFLKTRDYDNISLVTNEFHWNYNKECQLTKKVELNCDCKGVKQ